MDTPFPESPADTEASTLQQQLSRVAKLRIQAAVRLGCQRMTLKELCLLAPGAVIPFEIASLAPSELVVNETILATGEAVRNGTQLGFRLRRLATDAS